MTVKERTPADAHVRELPDKRRELIVRVYVYPREGRWFAETTDLSLLAEGASQGEALKCLLEQIAVYIRANLRHGWEDAIWRPAPLRHRIGVQLRVAWAKLQKKPAFIRTKPVLI